MNIRLRDKLLTGFVLLGLLIVMIAAGAFYALDASQSGIQKTAELYTHRKVAQAVSADFGIIKNDIQRYALTGDASLIDMSRARVEEIAKVLSEEKSKAGLLSQNKNHIQDVLNVRDSFLTSLASVEQLYQEKQATIKDGVDKAADTIVKKVEQLSEQASFSGNPDAAVSAAVMRGHFLAALLNARAVMQQNSTKEELDAFRKSVSSYHEAGAGLSVYLTDKTQIADVDKLNKDKAFEDAVYHVQEINGKIAAEMIALDGFTVDVTKKIETYLSGIKNEEDKVAESSSSVISNFKTVSLLFLIIGGGCGALFIVYLLRTLSDTVHRLSSGFMETQSAIARVSQASLTVESNIQVMSESAIETGINGQQIDSQTQTMSKNIGTMSSAMEQLDNSIRQIQAVTAASLGKVAQAVDRTSQMERVILEMGKASEQISSVVALINGLSEQTSLLALNATIEAARAGEAGKGFSVVADEVKKLAVATTESTESIRQQVARITNISNDAMGFMQDLTSCVRDIETNSTEINNSIVEQQMGTQSIGDNMSKILEFTESVSQSIKSISADMVQSGKLAEDVQGQTTVVTSEVERLNEIADEFHARLAQL